MFAILYNSGAGGDMVTAVIDSTDYMLFPNLVTAKIGSIRQQIKFASYDSKFDGDVTLIRKRKTELFNEAKLKYKAISEHDWWYFYQIDNTYPIIAIDDTDYTESCLRRVLKIQEKNNTNLHEVYENTIQDRKDIVQYIKSNNITDKIIPFEEILNGNLLTILSQWVKTPLNEDLYSRWLRQNKHKFLKTGDL
jgi:hypothetical protein